MRVLLIDDEVRKAQALIDYFQEVCGWIVEIAPGPDRALELLKVEGRNLYDLIILDIMMDPGMAIPRELSEGGRATGLFLLDLISTLTGGSISIVLYTARTDLDHLKRDGRVVGYIQKPRSVREIVREIEGLVPAARS